MPRVRSHSRSRSPYHAESSTHPPNHSYRQRSRSPPRNDRHHHHRSANHHSKSKSHLHGSTPSISLPLGAGPISKHDIPRYRPMFALYLDIQKQLDIEDLDEAEVKGRWKSFVGKWNRGELAEGWYDPTTLDKAVKSAKEDVQPHSHSTHLPRQNTSDHHRDKHPGQNEHDREIGSDDDDEFGPSLPTSLSHPPRSSHRDVNTSTRSGPSIPTHQDLRARNEQLEEEAQTTRNQALKLHRQERTLDRKTQRDNLDDILPRAEPGTKERQLEKKREKADANRAFAAAKDGRDGQAEMRDEDVMGGAGDSLGDLKRMQKEKERKKNDREIRREEALRARIAEREVRMKGIREKEEKTMEMLKDIARARFGSGGISSG